MNTDEISNLFRKVTVLQIKIITKECNSRKKDFIKRQF